LCRPVPNARGEEVLGKKYRIRLRFVLARSIYLDLWIVIIIRSTFLHSWPSESWMCRGIDAPESAMPYGKEAKEVLLKLVQGKCLKVFVYEEDRYGRCVGDIYCDGVFVQVNY
jgi:hypothetical protein